MIKYYSKKLFFRPIYNNFKRTILFKKAMTDDIDIKENENSNTLVKNSSMSFKIYTKTGDKGQTSLLGGIRINKHDQIFDLLGDIDELNSYLGLVLYFFNFILFINLVLLLH